METKLNNTKPLMRIKDFAEYIGISVSNLDRMQAESILPIADFLIGKGKIRIWKFETVQSCLDSQKNPKLAIKVKNNESV